jgi:hypothetical protein
MAGDPSVTMRVFLALIERLWEEHRYTDDSVPPWSAVVQPAQHALALAAMLCVDELIRRDSLALNVPARLPDLWERHYQKPPVGGVPRWDDLQELAQSALILAGCLLVDALNTGPARLAFWDPDNEGEA